MDLILSSHPETDPRTVSTQINALVELGLVRRPARGIYLSLVETYVRPILGSRANASEVDGLCAIPDELLQEDAMKEILKGWLERGGYEVTTAWGKTTGRDMVATRPCETWIIEVKGCGSLSAMRVNYFVGVLGETLQRMADAQAKYSIALPDMKQFRGLWTRLPAEAKTRTGISCLFVRTDGSVDHVK